jgi:hypothetical protein
LHSARGICRVRTVLSMSDVQDNVSEFKRRIRILTKTASPRSWYVVLLDDGKPRSCALSRPGIIPQLNIVGAVYMDASKWLDGQLATRSEVDGVPPAQGTV